MRRTRRWALVVAGITMGAAFIPSVAAPAGASGLPLTPLLDCVSHSVPGYTIAFFGYTNANAALTVKVGKKNKFAPGAKNRGQPTQFQTGTNVDEFAVSFTSASLTWSLKGPDGVVRTVTADASTPACASDPFTPAAGVAVGPITDHPTQQKHDASGVLIAAKVKFSQSATSVCDGSGVAKKATVTAYIKPWVNGSAKGPTQQFDIFDFATTPTLKITDPQLSFPPYALGNSTGWVRTAAVGVCDLGDGLLLQSTPVYSPDTTTSDVEVYCFVTDTTVAPQVTREGSFTAPPGGVPECYTDGPGGSGGIKFR